MYHLTEILSYVGIKKEPAFRLKDLLHTHYVFPLYFFTPTHLPDWFTHAAVITWGWNKGFY